MPWTGALQAAPPMEVSRQELWSGLPFPSPGALPYPGNPVLLIAGRIFILWATRKYEDIKYISLELPVFLQALFSEFLSTFRCQRIEDSPLFLRGDGGRNVGQLILKSVWRVHSLRNEEVDKNCRNWGCFVWKKVWEWRVRWRANFKKSPHGEVRSLLKALNTHLVNIWNDLHLKAWLLAFPGGERG